MKTRTLNIFCYLSTVILLLAATTNVQSEEIPESRLSTSSEGQGIGRGGSGDGTISHNEFDPLLINGPRSKSTRASGQQTSPNRKPQSGLQSSSGPNVEFWIYAASVELYADLDNDGFFYGVALSFDADTTYDVADVYAVLYLSYELGPWNEYASTADFTIFGASGTDEYVVDTELVSGYLTGEYDVLIELYDAFDGTFVASFGPDESSSLALLPLEDAGRDTPQTTTIIVHEGGGGALGLLGLLALFGVAGLARTRAVGA
jgi:hypothetical protein